MKKFRSFLIGLFVFVLVLEILLRVAGALFLWFQERQNKEGMHRDGYRILCLGESTTALGGEDAYPAQLERLLNAQSPSMAFKVINKGIPGVGSAYIAAHAKEWLDQYSPQMVIIMMGINDANDRIPVDELKRQGPGPFQFLVDLRVYKLYRWVYLNINERLRPSQFVAASAFVPEDRSRKIAPELVVMAEMAMQQKQYAQAERILWYIADKGSPLDNWQARMQLHKLYFATGEMSPLLDMVDKNPLEAVNIDVQMRLCREKTYANHVLVLLKKHLQVATDKWQWYNLMGGCLSYAGLEKEADIIFSLAKQEELAQVGMHTRANYLRLMDILAQRPLKVVVMQYPLRSLDVLKSMLAGARDSKRIIWVGNEDNFKEALKVYQYEELFADRFAGDFGHGTALGNKLIALRLRDIVLKQVMQD